MKRRLFHVFVYRFAMGRRGLTFLLSGVVLLMAACAPIAGPGTAGATGTPGAGGAQMPTSTTRSTTADPPATAAPSTLALAGCKTPDAGSLILRDAAAGFCLLYPSAYQVQRPNPHDTVLVIDSLLNVTNPRIMITVSEGGPALQAADASAAEFASVPGITIERSTATVDHETAYVLDNVPGQDISRQVFVAHEGRLYRLTFLPFDSAQAETLSRTEKLYETVMSSFRFVPAGQD